MLERSHSTYIGGRIRTVSFPVEQGTLHDANLRIWPPDGAQEQNDKPNQNE